MGQREKLLDKYNKVEEGGLRAWMELGDEHTLSKAGLVCSLSGIKYVIDHVWQGILKLIYTICSNIARIFLFPFVQKR